MLHGFLRRKQAEEAHVEEKSSSSSTLKGTRVKLPQPLASLTGLFFLLERELSLSPAHWALPTHSINQGNAGSQFRGELILALISH